MKIVLPGGSGQVGRILERGLRAAGHETVVLSRKPAPGEVFWDGETRGPWAARLDGADAVINLAGRSVNCRYTPANRAAILNSRVRSVEAVGQAIAEAGQPPHVWLQASTATIYAHRFDAANDEATGRIEAAGPPTWRFSLDVAQAWEQALTEAPTPQTRKVALRSAITLSPDPGGAFDVLSTLVRRGLGGTQGGGRQYVSWIHEADFVAAILFLLDRPLEGPVNLASPDPLPNRAFMRALREAWDVPFGLPSPGPLLEIGAWATGDRDRASPQESPRRPWPASRRRVPLRVSGVVRGRARLGEGSQARGLDRGPTPGDASGALLREAALRGYKERPGRRRAPRPPLGFLPRDPRLPSSPLNNSRV